MDINKEKTFCSLFIDKRMRDRIFYELQSPVKRRNALGRFCHNAEKIIRTDRIVNVNACPNAKELADGLIHMAGINTGYFISLSEQDGNEALLEQGIAEAIRIGMGFAVLVGDSIALIREEQMFGAPKVYVLKK